MAREYGRILCGIWTDPQWRARSPLAQWLYFLLISQRAINTCGVLPLQVSKWARGSEAVTVADVETALAELSQHRYVVVDGDTEEVLVRSFIRNDGVAKHPNMLKNALRVARQVESPLLRAALAQELRRLDLAVAAEVADEIDPDSSRAQAEPGANGSAPHPEPIPNARRPDREPDADPSRTPPDPVAMPTPADREPVAEPAESDPEPDANPTTTRPDAVAIPGGKGVGGVVPEEGSTSVGGSSLRRLQTKRGTRIPDDFAVTAEMAAWARDRVPHVDGRVETEKFINYWQAKSGKDATKVDWAATWRNWMLNAADRAPARASPPAVHPTDATIARLLGMNPPRLPGGQS
jgi:hypothetical protein